MAITTAQKDLLRKLEDGYEIAFSGGHYVTALNGAIDKAKLWPTTFYGLYDSRMIRKLPNGNYTISIDGKEQIRGEGT